MVKRIQLTYDEIMDVLDIKYFPSERIGYTLLPGKYEVSDINTTLKYLSTDFVKVTITIDDIRIKSNINIIETLIFTKRCFLYDFSSYSISPRSFKRY